MNSITHTTGVAKRQGYKKQCQHLGKALFGLLSAFKNTYERRGKFTNTISPLARLNPELELVTRTNKGVFSKPTKSILELIRQAQQQFIIDTKT